MFVNFLIFNTNQHETFIQFARQLLELRYDYCTSPVDSRKLDLHQVTWVIGGASDITASTTVSARSLQYLTLYQYLGNFGGRIRNPED